MSRLSAQIDASADPLNLVDRRAVDALAALEPVSRTDFDALSAAAKRRAFTAAGLTRDDVVEAVHRQVARAVAEGRTFDDWRRDVDAIFADAGYAPDDGWRAEATFRLQVSRAHAASRREAFDDPAVAEAFPYLMYSAVGDGRTRPSHAALDGKVLRRDDPFWDRFTPPWAYGCRCTVIPLTAEQAAGRGVRIEPTGELARAMEIQDRRPDPPFAGGHRNAIGAAAPREADFDLVRPAPWQPADPPEQLGVPALATRDPAPPRPAMATRADLEAAGLDGPEATEQLAAQLADRLGAPVPSAIEIPVADGRVVSATPARVRDLTLDGRERFLGALGDVLGDPDEVWLAEWQLPDGDVQLRRQFVRVIDDGSGRPRVAVATVRRGEWLDWDVLTPTSRRLASLRRGVIERVR